MNQMMFAAFLEKNFSYSAFTVLQTMTQKMTDAECIDKIRNQCSSEWLESECIIWDLPSLDQLRNHDFEDT